MENDTVKRRELAWKNVTIKVQDVLFPLMQATNAEQKLLLQVPLPQSQISECSSELPTPPAVLGQGGIKEINTTSSSDILPENFWLEHTIKAYASAQKKIAKYIGPSL